MILPDAQKVTFVQVPPVDLQTLLPNLPPMETQPDRSDCLNLVSRFLVYPPASRMRADAALAEPLFKRGVPYLLPFGSCAGGEETSNQYHGQSLATLLACYLSNITK